MKILMGNNSLSLLAGSETWTETLAKQFQKLGHQVTVYSPHLGLIATKLEAAGIKCTNQLETESGIKPFSSVFVEEAGRNFDVIICNHYEITKALHQAYPNLPIIATVHGILHQSENSEIWPEHPVTEFKVDQYVSVSEEVQEVLKRDYQLESIVIRNFIDLERFKKIGKIKKKPEVMLINSNYWGVEDPINHVIKEVANHYKAKLMGVGVSFAQTYEVDEVMRDADVVFGMGRSILEGIAMGKLAVCHGRWGTGGVITPANYEEIRVKNFSGRNSGGQLWMPQDIISYIDKAFTQENIDAMHKIMKKEHNVEIAAKKYLEIAEKLTTKK